MSTVTDTVRARVEVSPTSVVLLAGDLLAIALFVLIGEIDHGNRPFANPGLAFGTYAPFLIGWLLVAVVAGMYGPLARSSLRRAVAMTLGTWFLADLVGQALRSTAYFHGGTEISFFIVSFLFAGLFLTIWRVAVTAWLRRRSTALA
ncbi:MAG: DUF3054 domain-containing protein [Haloarculaceae archaeon]